MRLPEARPTTPPTSRAGRGGTAPTLGFRCASQVLWAIETRGILLVDPTTERSCSLPYPHAAIWDLMSRGCSYPKMISALFAIGSLEREEAERLLDESLLEWAAAGFVEKSHCDG